MQRLGNRCCARYVRKLGLTAALVIAMIDCDLKNVDEKSGFLAASDLYYLASVMGLFRLSVCIPTEFLKYA